LGALGAGAWRGAEIFQAASNQSRIYNAATAWSIMQARLELERFRESLARHVAGDPSVSYDDVRERFDILWSRVPLLTEDMPIAVEIDGLTLSGAQALAEEALKAIDPQLSSRHSARGDLALLENVSAHLEPARDGLARCTTGFVLTRQRLFDETRQTILSAQRLHNTTFSGFLMVAATLLALALAEAMIARRAEAAAVASEQRFKHFAHSVSDWLWETDADLKVTFVSERWRSIAGLSETNILGRQLTEVAEPVEEAVGRRYAADLEARRPFRDVVLASHGVAGERRMIQVSGSPVRSPDGVFRGYRGVGSDITDRLGQEQRIRFLAQHDSLTGLLNRAAFQEHLNLAVDAAARDDGRAALLLLDLDRFKDVNDTFGHDAGDALLREVANRLRSVLRPSDALARLGGDEFAALVPVGRESEETTEQLGRRIVATMAQPFALGEQEVRAGASVGAALCPSQGHDAEALLKAADLALYRAKQDGRGRYRLFVPEMGDELRHRRALERDLRHAAERGQLDLYYQPIVGIGERQLVGAEALLRWRHPEFGYIPPSAFVPLAEESGLILPLGRWALERACRDAAGWTGELGRLAVSVNLSPVQFAHEDDLVGQVTEALTLSGLAADRLVLEITETVLMRDQPATMAALEAFRALGVQLAIDDFGVGYSSLAYLRRFPVDKLKLDRSFLRDIERDPYDRKIVGAMILLGQSLGLATVAEGVESQAQLRCLADLGCDQAQGYLIGHPMPNADLLRFATFRPNSEPVRPAPVAAVA
jgi:diguanylate cyclase (GGDEF)-like protein/PAS domain S-box-containing protein